ncbi:MAG: AEC family transporter [Candidatus Izemoplasmatales bacterium]
MDTLIFALNAVLPIILLIGLGYILKLTGFLNDHFLDIANKIVFRIALPALLFYNIYSVPSLSDINWSVMIYAAIGIVVLLVIGLVFSKLFIKDYKQRGVITQGIINANFAIIGIPLAESIGGSMAVANVALISLVAFPLMNGFSVIVLSVYNDKEHNQTIIKNTLLKVIKNPPIIGVVLGFLVIWLRTFIPVSSITNELVFSLENDLKFLFTPIKWLSQIASPIALIVLGGTFKFHVIGKLRKQIALGTFLRSLLAPLIILGAAVILALKTSLLNFDNNMYPALIALFGSPTAIASAVLAKELKSDEDLAVQIVVWTTLASILTIFVLILVFKSLGLL